MKEITLVHHLHLADRAGRHVDWRIIVDGKAPSWATKKDAPPPGGKIILWEQPVHTKEYAETEEMVTPKGEYGAGKTTTTYRGKGKIKSSKGEHHLYMDDGQEFYIKKMPSHYGDKAWLLVNVSKQEKKAMLDELIKLAVERRKPKKKKKLLVKKKKKKVDVSTRAEIQYIQAIERQKRKLRINSRSLPSITKDVLVQKAQNKIRDASAKKDR